MKLVQVKNNQIIKWNLPKTGTLKNGRTVSGYDLLDEEILREEGWLPMEDNPPSYDQETQYILHDGYEILEDKVIRKYRVEDIHEPEPVTHDPSLEERNRADIDYISIMLGVDLDV